MNNGLIKLTPNQNTTSAAQPLNQPQQPSLKPMDPITLAKWEQYMDPGKDRIIPNPILEDVDYSKAKPPPNQIPIAQFWSFCEQMLRPLTEQDLKGLDEKVGPFSSGIVQNRETHWVKYID
jgi:hypothetical protein